MLELQRRAAYTLRGWCRVEVSQRRFVAPRLSLDMIKEFANGAMSMTVLDDLTDEEEEEGSEGDSCSE